MRSLALGINTSQMESAKTLRCNNAASSASPARGDRSQEIRLRLRQQSGPRGLRPRPRRALLIAGSLLDGRSPCSHGPMATNAGLDRPHAGRRDSASNVRSLQKCFNGHFFLLHRLSPSLIQIPYKLFHCVAGSSSRPCYRVDIRFSARVITFTCSGR